MKIQEVALETEQSVKFKTKTLFLMRLETESLKIMSKEITEAIFKGNIYLLLSLPINLFQIQGKWERKINISFEKGSWTSC